MVIVEVGGISVPHLPGKGSLILPSLFGVVGSPLMGPPIMVRYRSGGSPRAKTMMMAPEISPRGARLRPPNWLAMNS
jgi:hypothetical protein